MLRPIAVVLLAATPVVAAPTLSGDSLRQYTDAVNLVTTARYREAIPTLNTLARDNPRVAEVFATRCSAQLGNGSHAGAEADCRYAITLRPDLSTALYGLAVAEDQQGKAQPAAGHYREYAARADAAPQLKTQALARADALSAPQPLAVAAPPPPPAAAPVVAAAPPVDAGRGTLLIYRNHFFRDGNEQVTLLVDGKIVGDIAHDQYVEVQLPIGEHIVEACIGGVRYRRTGGGFPLLQINTAGGQTDVRLGNSDVTRDRIPGMTVPVEVAAGGPTYVNFDHSGGRLYLANQPADVGAREIQSDCRKAFTKKL